MEEERVKPELSKKKIVAIALIITIILASTLYWHTQLRPISVREMILQNPDAGDSVKLSDIISNISVVNTSYGQFQLLTLGEDVTAQIIWADMNQSYSVGERYQTTINFQNYWVNGNWIIGAPELMGPILYLPMAMETVWDAVSHVGGYYLELNDSNENYQEYKVFHNGTGVPLADMNVSLRQGEFFGPIENYEITTFSAPYLIYAQEYVNYMGGYDKETEIDFMSSLENQSSDNGLVEYLDVNSNLLLDTGDKFRIHISPTTNESIVTTYQLMIGGGMASQSINEYYGTKYIINWHEGPLEDFDLEPVTWL